MSADVIIMPIVKVERCEHRRRRRHTKPKKLDMNAAVYQMVRPSIDIQIADGDNDNRKKQ